MNRGSSVVVFTVAVLWLALPLKTAAFLIQIPDCNDPFNAQHPFCEGICYGPEEDRPSWCAPLEEPEDTREPVLIVPGLGASYNRKLMLKDQAGGDWRFAPTLDWFDALIERLEKEGYEQGKDLFIVHYDWRQANKQSAIQYLIPAIAAAKQTAGTSKVDVVAHSMGGLVTRAYAQSENLYHNDIDQLILLGTPNEGAASSYVAWEGGEFPKTWSLASRHWIQRIANSLKEVRPDTSDLKPPNLFRAFFPSLQNLLPITSFVIRGETELASTSLKAQNDFLQELAESSHRLDDRDIRVITIAGSDKQTLAHVPIKHERTREDEQLERWRDGHPIPDPPVPDSTSGDQTVLTDSVHAVGSEHITIADALHEELPAKAQNEIARLLVGNPVGDFVPSQLARAGLGIDVLSPLDPLITGPSGEILSKDTNTFSNAEFDWDPADPDGPKVLTIADPPPGQYTFTFTGTGNGPYTVITTYADKDETISSTSTGTAQPQTVMTQTLNLTATTSNLIDDTDYQALLNAITVLAEQAHKDKILKGHERANITRPVNHAFNDLRLYEQRLQRGRTSAALDRLRSYYINLTEIEQALRDSSRRHPNADFLVTALQYLTHVRHHSPTL